jgi:MoaA/NifB/PqqE/SkfB family radical SAM enzyme
MAILARIREMYLDGKLFLNTFGAVKFRKRRPLFVALMVTNRCNMRCIYCLVQANTLKVGDPPLKEIYRIIDELYSLGTRYISLQGGEPLLRDDIGEIIDYINRKGMITELITNGLLIRERLEELKRVKRLCLSIDGFGDYNDRQRGKGTFEKAIENFYYAKAEGLDIYRIEATFTRLNATDENLLFLARLTRELDCIFTPFAGIITDYNASGEFAKIALRYRGELVEFWQKIKQLRQQGYDIHYHDRTIENVRRMPEDVSKTYDAKTARKMRLTLCTQGRIYCYIDTDGMMYPCIPLVGIKGYSIYEHGIPKCWELLGTIDCSYCFMANFCSFGGFNLQTIAHFVKTYFRYIMKKRRPPAFYLNAAQKYQSA